MSPPLNSPIGLVFLLCVAIILFSIPTAIFAWLWNITIPGIFKVRPITFWEAFRLLLIGAMLSSGGFIHFNAGR